MCDLAITSRSLENAAKSAERIAADTGRKVAGFSCDVRFEDQVESMVHTEYMGIDEAVD